MPTTTDIYAYALSYAADGWLVCPLHHITETGRCSCGEECGGSAGKHPRISGGLKNASRDPEQIRRWWRQWPYANIAVITGEASGIAVLDVDPKNGGNDGLQQLIAKHGALPPTLRSRTGSGGHHYVFRYPAGMKIGNRAGTLGVDGVDFRGNGGYIVAPPSNHISGGEYQWDVEGPISDPPGWLLQLVLQPQHKPAKTVAKPADDGATYWLQKAMQRASVGSRNETGFWLATQMRDSGVPESVAFETMRYYARMVSTSDAPYYEDEAEKSCRSAYSRSPREKASKGGPIIVPPKPQIVVAEKPAKVVEGTVGELERFLRGVESGEIYNVPWRQPITTALTQSLVPGATVTFVGDPGAGKTYFMLDQILEWDDTGEQYAALFLEKDRRFYAQRLLASMLGDSRVTMLNSVKQYPEIWKKGIAEHGERLQRIGKNIYTRQQGGEYTPQKVAAWVRTMASAGKRVIIIDPVTLMSKGREIWNDDQWFVDECQAIAGSHACSVIFVSHPSKGNRKTAATGHDTAGGAAWFRFVDNEIWLTHEDPPISFRVQTLNDGIIIAEAEKVLSLLKTRDARGAGKRIGLAFERMRYREIGLILGEADDEEYRRPMPPEEIGGEPESPF